MKAGRELDVLMTRCLCSMRAGETCRYCDGTADEIDRLRIELTTLKKMYDRLSRDFVELKTMVEKEKGPAPKD